jgi:hypothetical protein
MFTQYDRVVFTQAPLPAVAIPDAAERLDLIRRTCPAGGTEVSVMLNGNHARIAATGHDTSDAPTKLIGSMLVQHVFLAMELTLTSDGEIQEAKFGVPLKPVVLGSEPDRLRAEGVANALFTHLKTALEFGTSEPKEG